MKTVIEELVWTMHRAEGTGVLSNGFQGEVRSLGEGTTRPIETEEEVNVFNLGVQAGVQAMLDQLHEEGYVLTDKLGRHVRPEVLKGKPLTFSDSYKRWHNPNPKLEVVGG